MIDNSLQTCGELIQCLSKFPKDKPVKILALGIDYCNDEEIYDADYPMVHQDDEYDEEGNPVFVKEDDCVYIFTKDYVENQLMNGV